MHSTLLVKHSGEDEDEVTVRDIARHVFEQLDLDGGGTLQYKELHAGLPDFGVFLTKKVRPACQSRRASARTLLAR